MRFTDLFLAVGVLMAGWMLCADLKTWRLTATMLRVTELVPAGKSKSRDNPVAVSRVRGILQTAQGPVDAESDGAAATVQVSDWVGTSQKVHYDPATPHRFQLPRSGFVAAIVYGIGAVFIAVGVIGRW